VAATLEAPLHKYIEEKISRIPPPQHGRDGVGVAGALIDADGQLVVTLSDGTLTRLGRVNGHNGADGRDGLGFDDFSMDWLGDRTLRFVFSRGDQIKQFDFIVPIVVDQGTFKEGRTYARGDGVTWAGGSFFIAQKDDPVGLPGISSDWRLAARKGRDGTNGKNGKDGERGPMGPQGKSHWET
jgi:hypothetical protein